MAVELAKRLLTVEEYHTMADAGILTEDDRVELIHGEIIQMSPIKSKHAGHVKWISNLLKELLGKKVMVGVQDPIEISNYSEPEPDIVLLHRVKHSYTLRHPRPEDIILVIEVADTSVKYDREIKLPLYAAAGITEYWIVNLVQHQIEVYQQPGNETYKLRRILDKDDEVVIEFLELKLSVGDLFV